MRTYTEEEIMVHCQKDNLNHPHIADLLMNDWDRLTKELCLNYSIALGGYDKASKYISDMEGQEYDTTKPELYWEEFCFDYEIEHEINNNPFL